METISDYKVKFAFGITSVCSDGNHIYMADIDEDIDISNVNKIAMDIMRDYKLKYMNVVKSTNGYNIFSFDKIPLKYVHQINEHYPSIDQQFNNIAFSHRKFYVLRIGVDKEHITTITNAEQPLFTQSNAHRIFFNNMFDINIPKNIYFDESERFRIIRFRSQKHGVEMNE